MCGPVQLIDWFDGCQALSAPLLCARQHLASKAMRTTVALLAAAAASAKNVRFCCKTEFPETQLGDPFCGRQDLVFVGHRQESRAWSRDTVLEFLNGVATNLLFLLPLRMLHARRRTADTAACVGLIITSSAYHYCDVFRIKLLGMNAGNWHRLDNIFAIVTPVAVVPLLMGRARTPQHQRDIDFVRWSSLFIGLFFQELNPWNVLCTITPVILAFLYYLWWWNTVHKSNRRVSTTAQSWPLRHRLDVGTTACPWGLSPLDAVSTCTRFTG